MSYRCNTPGAAEPFWERAYQDFDGVTFAGGKASREFYELVKLLPAGSKVLDIGCGDGRHALFLAENGYAVTAIDISAAGISKIEYLARQKSLSIVTQVVDMRKYCFTEDFDLIIAHGCLHFVERPQWQDLLANMKAHTTPNGFNVVTVFTDTIAPPEDLKAFCLGLLSEGEIYDCYSDWKILHQESYILKDEHPNTLPHEHPINKIVAQNLRTDRIMIDFNALAIVPARDEDYEFSFQVKKLAQGPWIIRLWGWDEKKQRMFHQQNWDEKRPSLITYAGNPIGTIRVTRDDDGFDIQQFFLLPEYHNSGIGSHLMRRVLCEADEAGEPVRLAILLGSRVKSFYERLGFRVLRQDESFCFMKRPAQPART